MGRMLLLLSSQPVKGICALEAGLGAYRYRHAAFHMLLSTAAFCIHVYAPEGISSTAHTDRVENEKELRRYTHTSLMRLRSLNRRIASSGLLCRVALVRTDVSEEPGASFIRATKIGELGTTQAVTSNRRALRRNTDISSQRTSVASCSDFCHPDEGGARFLRHVGSYKSHTA
jgi:hypothetical protein